MFPVLLEPMDLALTSLIPAASSTVRTEEPAITPVPCALGLKKMHRSVELADTPATRGAVAKVAHLVTVEEL